MPVERAWLLWASRLAQTIGLSTIANLLDCLIVTSSTPFSLSCWQPDVCART